MACGNCATCSGGCSSKKPIPKYQGSFAGLAGIGQTESKSGIKTGQILDFAKLGLLIWGVSKVTGLFKDTRDTGEGKEPPPDIPLPPNATFPPNWSPAPLAQKLAEKLASFAMFDWQILQRNLALLEWADLETAAMFIDVNNYFNRVFGGGKTLRQTINEEYNIPTELLNRLHIRMNQNGISGMRGMGNQGGMYYNYEQYPQPFRMTRIIPATESLNDDLYRAGNRRTFILS